MIPSITNRCFLTKSLSSIGLTKQIAQSNCQVLGGNLVAFETLDKLTAVLQWLSSKTSSSKYFWLNSALQTTLNSQSLWVWASNGQMINYNWAASQSTNFNGDSLFLNTTDNQFYVGIGSQTYSPLSGFLCEASVSGLSSNNLNILFLNQAQAYSTTG